MTDSRDYADLIARLEGATIAQHAFMHQLAHIVIDVAERPAELRGPWIFDEAELQKMAAGARRFIDADHARSLQNTTSQHGDKR